MEPKAKGLLFQQAMPCFATFTFEMAIDSLRFRPVCIGPVHATTERIDALRDVKSEQERLRGIGGAVT